MSDVLPPMLLLPAATKLPCWLRVGDPQACFAAKVLKEGEFKALKGLTLNYL